MAANAKLYVIFGASAGNHSLGSQTKEAGVSFAAGVGTCDCSQAHTWQPRGPDSVTATVAPAGYTKLSQVYGFDLSRDSVAASASRTKVTTTIAAAGGVAVFELIEDTSRVWTFRISGTLIPGSYTPPDGNRHHVQIWVTKVSGGSYLSTWSASDTLWVTIKIDGTIQFNDVITASGPIASVGSPIFGQSSAVGNSPSFTFANVSGGYSDRAAPLGKVTVKEWTFTTGAGTPAGHDQSTKSTGTDAAALVDERPPAGSGTTDVDWYQLIDDGTHLSQHSALANTLLAAGDLMYGAALKIWMRQNTSGKLTGAAAQMHDGTNNSRSGANALISGQTSYAEDLFTNDGGVTNGGGGSQDALFFAAPDAAAWSGKNNTYLDGCYAGAYMNGATANASVFIDAIVVEAAIVLSADAASALSDPGVTATTERRRGGIV